MARLAMLATALCATCLVASPVAARPRAAALLRRSSAQLRGVDDGGPVTSDPVYHPKNWTKATEDKTVAQGTRPTEPPSEAGKDAGAHATPEEDTAPATATVPATATPATAPPVDAGPPAAQPAPHAGEEVKKPSVTELVVHAVVDFLVLVLFAFLYSRWKPEVSGPMTTLPTPIPSTTRGWEVGLFHCFGNWQICLLGCCCAEIRWAHTQHSAKLWGFWSAVLILGACLSLSALTWGITGLAALVIVTMQRQHLRKVFSLNSGGITWVEDCCVYFWCGCCAVIQEAQQVEMLKLDPAK